MTASEGSLVAIASGKGGVGKTWLSITLAHSLAQASRRVLLIDGDLGLANIDVQLGISPRSNLSASAARDADIAAAITSHPAGFDLVAGRSGNVALAEADGAMVTGLLHGIRTAAASYDVVLLDLAAGIKRAGRRFAVASRTLLVVATDDPTSLTDAYAVLKLYLRDRSESDMSRARIVINQAVSVTSGRKTYSVLARACETFLGTAPRLAGIVRRDDNVRMAIRRQLPLLQFAPNCAAAQDVAALVEAL